MKKRSLLWFGPIFLLSAYCALMRLDNVVFWDDEAYVVLMARNYLEAGRFTGWTGRNLYGYANGTVLTDTLRPINPPLDVLVTAASFRLFGVSEWSARLPFALAALAGLLVFGAIVRREWKDHWPTQIYAFGCLGFSVAFLLNARTCRYYSLALLFSLGCYWFYQSTLLPPEDDLKADSSKPRPRDWLGFAGCATALFYSQFLLCAVFLTTLAIAHLAWHHRKWKAIQWRACLGTIFLFLACTVPYAVMFRIWERPDLLPSTYPWLLRRLVLLNLNFTALSQSGYIPFLVMLGYVPVIIFIVLSRLKDNKKLKGENPEWRVPFLSRSHSIGAWLSTVICYIVLLSMLSAMPVHGPFGIGEIRYFIPILPFCAGLTGLLLGILHEYSRSAAALLFVILVSCNALTISPGSDAFRWLLPGVMQEIHHPYPTGVSETIKYLRAHSAREDVVRAVRQHHNYPLMVYLDKELRFGGLLNRQTPLPPTVLAQLDAPLLVEDVFPDWLIFFGRTRNWRDWLVYFSRPVQQNGKWVAHPYRQVKTLAIFFDQTQRPELPWHSFGPVTPFDANKEAVYIYRRSTPVPVKAPPAGKIWKLPPVRD